jgi:hypothetical protein
MTTTTTAALTGVLILASTVWLGGLAAIAVVARVATRTLDPAARVTFFRGLGRAYGLVGTTALALAYAAGAAVTYGRSWDGLLTATAAVATALAVTLAVGVAQARHMTRLRRQSLAQSDDADLCARVHRGAGRAGALRGLIALLSLALLALGVAIGTH